MSNEWTDDEIIGAILAGGSKRPILSGLGSFGQVESIRRHCYEFSQTPARSLPCCAVGAGLLFRGLTINDERATSAFAKERSVQS